MALDNTREVDMAGLDEVVSNERSRATRVPLTLTGTAALGTAYTTNLQGTNWIVGFGPPRTATTAAGLTLLAADLLTGVITITASGAGLTMTLDTATNLVAAVNNISSGAQVGDFITCLIINGGGTNTFTLTQGTGGGFDGNNANRTIATSGSKVVQIRLNNVTAGSEAYTIYF